MLFTIVLIMEINSQFQICYILTRTKNYSREIREGSSSLLRGIVHSTCRKLYISMTEITDCYNYHATGMSILWLPNSSDSSINNS